jgi:hypothetical protein
MYIIVFTVCNKERKSLSEVVSVRIKKETKDALERNGVDIPNTVRNYLEELSWKVQSRKKVEELHQLIENKVKTSRKGSAVSSVREDRDHGH